ncbi:hypothetical protein FRB99_009000 [Tulasnella sp. 403]|nr:hypothetical protein FRB99_009000 [Tulasnella sp. 403]
MRVISIQTVQSTFAALLKALAEVVICLLTPPGKRTPLVTVQLFRNPEEILSPLYIVQYLSRELQRLEFSTEVAMLCMKLPGVAFSDFDPRASFDVRDDPIEGAIPAIEPGSDPRR